MYQLAKKIYKLGKNILLSPFVVSDYQDFKQLDKEPRFKLEIKDFYPQVFDKTVTTGFDRHYVYHTAWAARKVKEISPEVHIDIASSLYFPSIVSAFVPVEFYDYRPAPLTLSNLTTQHADLTNLHFASNSILSLSCLHTIEHIGLGRYGDPIDPNGDKKACTELSRVLAPGGSLLFVTPVGKEAVIQFNAHRIYTYDLVKQLFPDLELKEFSFIPEKGVDGIHENANPNELNNETYACGCFWFVKPKTT
jgi:SAM-dependent methyltransferase